MKYLCLICAEVAALPDGFREFGVFLEVLLRIGFCHLLHYGFLECNRLQPPDAAITVGVRKGKVTTTDGPFAETKEQLGGYYIIAAKDLNEAIQIASRIPGARIGCAEMWPITEDERTLRALGFADTAMPQ